MPTDYNSVFGNIEHEKTNRNGLPAISALSEWHHLTLAKARHNPAFLETARPGDFLNHIFSSWQSWTFPEIGPKMIFEDLFQSWFYAAFFINNSWNFQHTVPYWTSLLLKKHFWLACSKIFHLEINYNEIFLSFLFRFSGVTQFVWQANKSDTMPYLWDRSTLENPLLGYMEGGGGERERAWSLCTLDEAGITVQTPLHHNSC